MDKEVKEKEQGTMVVITLPEETNAEEMEIKSEGEDENKILIICKNQIIIDFDKELLIEKSVYFQQMFCKNPSNNTFEMQNFCSDAMNVVKNLLIGSPYCLTKSLLAGTLRIATILEIQEVIDKCIRFIDARLSINNCLEISVILKNVHLENFYPKPLRMCKWEFPTISRDNSYLSAISFSALRNYLQLLDLRVPSEMFVFEVIEQWILSNQEIKKSNERLYALLQTINFANVTSTELRSMLKSSLVSNDVRSFEFLKRIFLLKTGDKMDETKENFRDKELQVSTISAVNRPLRQLPLVPVLVGSSVIDQDFVDIAYYSQNENTFSNWKELSKIFRNLKATGNFSICSIGSKFYVIGCTYKRGKLNDSLHHNKFVWSYDVIYSLWCLETQLQIPRLCPYCCAYEDSIYVLGGMQFTGDIFEPTTLFEKYDPSTKQWIPLAETPIPLDKAPCTVFGDLLFVFPPKSVLVYDPRINEWSQICFHKILEQHEVHSALNHTSSIFLVSKFKIFFYIPENKIVDEWVQPALGYIDEFPKATERACFFMDKIFAFHTWRQECYVQIYDLRTKQFTMGYTLNAWSPSLKHGIAVLPKY